MTDHEQEAELGGESKAKVTSARAKVGYTYFDHDQSLDVARKIHERAGGSCTPDQLSAFLSYSSTKSGTYQTRISSAKQFGYIQSDGSHIGVTERALKVLSPVMPEDAINAKAEAFLSVELFREVFSKYQNTTIPTEGGLKNLLVTAYGLSADRVGPAVRVMMDSAEQCGFFSTAGDRSRLIKPVTRSNPVKPEVPVPEVKEEKQAKPPVGSADGTSGVHSAIIGLLRELPPPGADWPKKQKARFVKAFQATLDFIYPSDEDEADHEKKSFL